MSDGNTITITVSCARCQRSQHVLWPADQYSALLYNDVTLDGTVELGAGWHTAPDQSDAMYCARCVGQREEETGRKTQRRRP